MSNEPQKTWPEILRIPGRSKEVTASHVVSVGVHTLPWLVPLIISIFQLGSLDIKDQEGELVVPIDMIDDPNPPSPPPAGTQAADPLGAGIGLEGGVRPKDAGGDAPVDAPPEGAPLAELEGGIAYLDPDGGAGEGGVGFDPSAQLGDLGKISAGTNNITITVNFGVVRTHPLGPRVQPIILAIPEWKQFMANTNVDPYRDWDWMTVFGPSLLDTSKDVVIIHYAVTDAEMEKAALALSTRDSKGGPADVGVAGVKAWRTSVAGSERALIRGQSHCLLMVPWTHAKQFATMAKTTPCVLKSNPGEAGRARFHWPGGSIAIFPPQITELRMWLIPRNSDSGGDLYMEGDTADPATATQAADDLRKNVANVNSLVVRLATGSVLSGIDIKSDGNLVKIHLPGSKEQIEAIIGIAAARVGVPPPAPSGSGP